jgi:hypothetical protein
MLLAKGLDVRLSPWYLHFHLENQLEHCSVFLLVEMQTKTVSDIHQDLTDVFFAGSQKVVLLIIICSA